MISLITDRPAYAPGDTIGVEVVLNHKKPVKARGLFIALSCEEQKMVQKTHILDQYDFFRRKQLGIPPAGNLEMRTEHICKEVFRGEKKIGGARIYPRGALSSGIAVPKDARPSSYEFGHDNRKFIWRISAKLDVPARLDWHVEKEITVISSQIKD